MSDTTVVISGSGKMGRQVFEAVLAAPGLVPVAAVDALAQGDAWGALPLYRDPDECFAAHPADVVIDFTNAEWTPVLAQAAMAHGVRMVIGTTGLSAGFVDWLAQETAARKLGAVLAANFAIGAVLMMHFSRLAAPYFEAAEIIELHHDQKVDSPSGTAKATAEMMRAARAEAFRHKASERETLPGARGAEYGGIAIHSVRLPGFVAHQEVIFGGLGQTLTIRHDTTGRDSFMPGVVYAVREVLALDTLVVGLDRLMGLSD